MIINHKNIIQKLKTLNVQVRDSSTYETKKHVYFLFHSRIIGPKALWFSLLICASKYQALDKQWGVWDTTLQVQLHCTTLPNLKYCPASTETRSITIR